MVHSSGADPRFAEREFCLAAYLIVASPWSFYGVSAGWTPDVFPRYPEFDRELGVPRGEAHKAGTGRWTREFEHVSVTIDTGAPSASVTWQKGD